jgi:hypothetical protein
VCGASFGTYQADEPTPSCLADLGRGAERVEQLEGGRVLDPRAQHPFQGRVDLGQQATEPIGDPRCLAREVLVEADDHLQFGDSLVGELDGSAPAAGPAGARESRCPEANIPDDVPGGP